MRAIEIGVRTYVALKSILATISIGAVQPSARQTSADRTN